MKYECEWIKNMELVASYKHCIQSKETNALTSLLLTIVYWINKRMNVNVSKIWNELNCKKIAFNWNEQHIFFHCYWKWSIESTKQWMWMMKYECECIKNMEWFESCRNYIHSKQKTALTLLFQTMVDWIDETMNVSASKILNESNRTKITFSQNKKCTYLAITDYGWINIQNNEKK